MEKIRLYFVVLFWKLSNAHESFNKPDHNDAFPPVLKISTRPIMILFSFKAIRRSMNSITSSIERNQNFRDIRTNRKFTRTKEAKSNRCNLIKSSVFIHYDLCCSVTLKTPNEHKSLIFLKYIKFNL